jgi:tRNA1Val (adenine37-N6)-methyltransferase
MTDPVADARQRFPSGMIQPDGGFRFAVDSLLLASFAPPASRVMDLGSGCGVIGLSYLLGHAGPTSVLGVDASELMTSCARANAGLLGLTAAFKPLLADVLMFHEHRDIKPESFDLVLLNPPFRAPGSGRLSSSPAKRSARFEDAAGLGKFLDGAAYALKNRSPLCLVYLAERLAALIELLGARRLEPKRMLLVHGHASAPAKVVLVEARKNGRPGLRIDPPLLLYRDGEGGELTEAAVTFCPFLRKGRGGNVQGGGSGPSHS